MSSAAWLASVTAQERMLRRRPMRIKAHARAGHGFEDDDLANPEGAWARLDIIATRSAAARRMLWPQGADE